MPNTLRSRRTSITLAALSIVAVSPLLSACSDTYIDDSATATTAPAAPVATTLAPVDPEASLDELMLAMTDALFGLDQQVRDDENPERTLARVEEYWALIEPQLDDGQMYRVGQAIELARKGVGGNRPADASKAYKILFDLSR